MKNRERRLAFILSVFFLFSILSLSLVNSAGVDTTNFTMVTPTASGTVTGSTYAFNVSINDVTATGFQGENFTRFRVWVKSAGLTGNTSEVLITDWIRNDTLGDGYSFNGTADTRTIEDGTDYTFKVELWNGSRTINVSRSSITFGNTVPQAPSSLVPTSVTSNSLSFSSVVVGRNTTACTLFFNGINPGSPSYTMIHSGNNCSYSFTSIPEQSYQWYVRASDGVDTSDSSTQTTKVDVKTSAGKSAQYISQGLASSQGGASYTVNKRLVDNPLAMGGIIFGAVLLIAIVIFVIRKK